jgi:shikimate kinase
VPQEPDRVTVSPEAPVAAPLPPAATVRRLLGERAVVLVGMMGAGKSSIGKRLAAWLDLPFVDADAEIETAANATIEDMFERYGEAYFRDGERRVIQRLLDGKPKVLATGGGAYMNPETRAAINAAGVAVWLKADFDVLMSRVRRRANRPLLKTGDPAETMRRLMAERYPVYAQAPIHIESREVAHETVLAEIATALVDHLAGQADSSRGS